MRRAREQIRACKREDWEIPKNKLATFLSGFLFGD
jgi:hypothetical protein